MALPAADRTNPREVARSVALAGRFHDVVVAASRVLHAEQLDKDDRKALRWAKSLLDAAARRDVIVAMPSAQQLAGPSNPILILRQAAGEQGDDRDQALADLRNATGAIIRGERNADLMPKVESLRTAFAFVSRIVLREELATQGQQSSGGSWPPSLTTLPS